MANAESIIQQDIRVALGRRPDVTIFRNNVGEHKLPNGGKIRYGLCVGSADLIGLVRARVAGMLVGLFLAVEVKTDTGRPTAEQLNFIRHINDMGGIAYIARSVDEATTKLEDALARIRLIGA